MVVELTATVENHAQGLHADIVSCRTAAQDQLKQAMADVDKLLSSKSDITVVEQLILGLDKHAAKLNLLSDRLDRLQRTIVFVTKLLSQIKRSKRSCVESIKPCVVIF